MLYVLISLVLGFGIIRLIHYANNYDFKGTSILCSLLVSLVCLWFIIASVCIFGGLDSDYKTCSENYQLKEVYENQYYVTNTEGNSISVYIMDGTYWEKKTFPENKVKFQSTTNEANVQIELKKLQKPSTAEKFWLLKGVGIKQKKEVYKSVIISVPEKSAVTESIGYSDPEYRNVNSTYDIKEIQASKYYTTSSDGDSVSVLIDKGSEFEKETFPEDVVNFVETNDSAKVTMDMKVFQNPSKTDEVLFCKLSEPNEEFPEKIYEAVTIYIPKGSETVNQAPEVESSEKQPAEIKTAYCSECGTEIGNETKFCSGCGTKVK